MKKFLVTIMSMFISLNIVHGAAIDNIKELNGEMDSLLAKIEYLYNNSINYFYPVGSIYMSVNSTDPTTLFGGTWEQLKDRFLLGAGDSYGNGTTGGEASHTLTINEMPSHTHTQNPHAHSVRAKGFNGTSNINGYYMLRRNRNDDSYDNVDPSAAMSATATNQNTGGGASHNNMPPYLVVYMWKRVS